MAATEANRAEQTRDELKVQLEATRRDMQILAGMVRERASARALSARDEMLHRVDELSEEARAMLGAAQVEAMRLADEATDTIRRNPLAAIGIAFALGWLIGKMFRR